MFNRNQNGIAATLKAAILSGDSHFLNEDKLIPERSLAEAFGVSRRVLREALNHLEGDGLIYRRQGQGTFIREVNTQTTSLKSITNRTSPQDVMEVRQDIEPILAGLAAIRATQLEIDQLKHFVRRAALSNTPADYEKWDSAFHTTIAKSVRNPMYWSIYRLINSVRKEHHWINSRRQVFVDGVSQEMVEQHEAIVDAIQQRDISGAKRAMLHHIKTAEQRINEAQLFSKPSLPNS